MADFLNVIEMKKLLIFVLFVMPIGKVDAQVFDLG
jgi:hypothetical protein